MLPVVSATQICVHSFDCRCILICGRFTLYTYYINYLDLGKNCDYWICVSLEGVSRQFEAVK